MTEEQCREKLAQMAEDLPQHLISEGMRLFHSGGVDPEAFDDNYVLPKALLTLALEHNVGQYEIDTKEFRSTVKNLRHF